ncbi:helix-turn-helix domain-containing protein [Actinoplanes sp. NPDC026670]|uniref:helix-turn-helix domain-containing protein n=1 Tax=Actinoplanes sp. NPDC026670 TaxID=3154700 RepID=UPI0033E68566
MTYAKYTRDMLTEAVAASTSMAGVLRHLGLRLNGGSHAHLRRRITQLGIDTSHFLGSAHARGTRSPRRRRPEEILIERPPESKRQAPTLLRRALEETGRPYLCAECGIDGNWNGRSLTLQVDHIDGRFWNCQAENLRFLCPNCHSQTANYAGRNRPRYRIAVVRVDERGDPVTPAEPSGPVTEESRIDVIRRVARKDLSVADAGRALGCNAGHVYTLMRRWQNTGTLAPAQAPRKPRIPAATRTEIAAFAVANPTLGPRKVAAALRSRPSVPITVSASTVENILREAGLNTAAARSAASSARERHPTDYTLHNALP